jgi:hypothetical protein
MEEGRHRFAEDDERSPDEHENFMLRHVHPEELFSNFVNRGIERNKKRNPT